MGGRAQRSGDDNRDSKCINDGMQEERMEMITSERETTKGKWERIIIGVDKGKTKGKGKYGVEWTTGDIMEYTSSEIYGWKFSSLDAFAN